METDMPKFLFFYHGGHFPPEVTDGNHVAWRSWMERLGDGVIDSGGPLQPTKTLATGGQLVTNTGSSEVTGYTIIAADSFDEALAIARACPQTAPPLVDGTIEIAELMDM
jgi:hypothetical protein